MHPYPWHTIITVSTELLPRYHHAWAPKFVLAPLPNALSAHCGGDGDFSSYGDEGGSAAADLGRFITSIFVTTRFALALVLAQSKIIKPAASIMTIIGGGLVCRTTVSDPQELKQDNDEF